MNASQYATAQLRKVNEAGAAITASILRKLLEDAFKAGAASRSR